MERIPSILDKYPDYELVIGIEVHVQLTTQTKIFCGCPNKSNQEPNSNICMICAGYPGILPVLNKQVVDYAILAGLATNCSITRKSSFDRKHYFYPDLPKGYQITQQFYPVCTEGYLPITLEDGNAKKIRINRIHMEEDAGKNVHAPLSNESFVDLNRAGTPLLEIVSYPDISSTYEAREYLKTLHALIQYLGISTGNMEEGAFRADTNISVRKKGATKLGTKCELKNINSFKFITDAIEYEIERQITRLEQGLPIIQETRLWNTKTHETRTMRSKEEATDYRYFQDPDLPFLEISDEWIDRMRNTMPELPHQKLNRYIQQGLSAYEAGVIIEDLDLVHYYEELHKFSKSKQAVNWMLRDLIAYTKEHKINIKDCLVTPEKLAQLITLLESGAINNHAAKEVFNEIAQSGKEPTVIIKEKNLGQVGSVDTLEPIIKEIITANPDIVAQFKSGNERLFAFFVGQAMKKTQGKGNPQIIQELLKKHLQ